MPLSTDLLERSTGLSQPATFRVNQWSRLVHALQPAPHVRVDGYAALTTQNASADHAQPGVGADGESSDDESEPPEDVTAYAHATGVNAMVIDRFEGRYMLSGGADGGLTMWDLESSDALDRQPPANASVPSQVAIRPLGSVAKSESTHRFGITAVSFYPFDSLAFLSTSYDHTLKVYSSTELKPSASFTLESKVYSHALSPVASHLLVACATQHPAVRLVDLRSGATTHSLVGHSGAVLSVAWSPKNEFILASGSTDYTVRFWDVRRSAGTLGTLDYDDSVGVVGYDGLGTGARRHDRGRAHAGTVNGIVWTQDANHVVTAGHDERVRVWDTQTGANTLANFGPVIRNRHLSTIGPITVSRDVLGPREDILFYPNEREILMYELFDGNLIKRLRIPGVPIASQKASSAQRDVKHRITALAWRAHNVEMFSAHSDGTIRSWQPRTKEDAFLETAQSSDEEDEEEQRRKKRRRGLNSFFY